MWAMPLAPSGLPAVPDWITDSKPWAVSAGR